MKVWACLLIFGLRSPALAAAIPPPAVLAAVTQELEAGGSDIRLAPRLLKPVRIGKEAAWQANFEKAGAVDWCGSGGCRVALYAEVKRDWQPVFDHLVRQFRLKGDRLTVELYGKFCGKAGNAACMARYRWDAGNRTWQPLDKAPPPLDEL
jgi:hypothetical protein